MLAHQLRVSAPPVETTNSRVIDRDFMTRHVTMGACTGNPTFIGYTAPGSAAVSLGGAVQVDPRLTRVDPRLNPG